MKIIKSKKEGEWKEIIPVTYTEAETAILKAEDRDAVKVLLREKAASATVECSQDDITYGTLAYEEAKLELGELKDYKLLDFTFGFDETTRKIFFSYVNDGKMFNKTI